MTSPTDVTSRRLDLAGTGASRLRVPVPRAALADFGVQWLGELWEDATAGRRLTGVALASVGSLARRDGGPLSDFDLVLLHQTRALGAADLTALADRLWYPIWDQGVKLDHSVRTVNLCRTVAGADLSAAVGLLDITYVAGEEDVVNAAKSTVAHDWRANARTRLPQLQEQIAQRHSRQGDLAHLLEPDLKEARGGLRDMTVLRALAAAWLADRPHGAVDAAYEKLLDVRDAVHVVTGRGRDRLAREDHDAAAALLGYHDADELLTDVSTSARLIAYSLDGTLRRAAQAQRARTLRVGPRRPRDTARVRPVPLRRRSGPRSGRRAGRQPAADPARRAGRRPQQRQHRAGHPAEPREELSADPDTVAAAALAVFGDLLATGPGLVAVWEGLDLAGVVERWIPEWAAVRSRPQPTRSTGTRRPAPHRDRRPRERPAREVNRPDLLLLAALLHDIGKVPGNRDHSETGAPIADRALQRLGVEDEDRALVVRLVREHLTLIDLATRRDGDDPRTIAMVSRAVGAAWPTSTCCGPSPRPTRARPAPPPGPTGGPPCSTSS